MKSIRIVIVAACLFAASFISNAQNYDWALGVRGGGNSSGVSLKYVWSDWYALELGYDFVYPVDALDMRYGNQFSVINIWNRPIINFDFIFFYGVGMHGGSYLIKKEGEEQKSRFGAGLDWVAGLEYKIPIAPVAISLEYRPFFNLFPVKPRFYLANLGLGLKLVF